LPTSQHDSNTLNATPLQQQPPPPLLSADTTSMVHSFTDDFYQYQVIKVSRTTIFLFTRALMEC
jgi:hypothetical protein